MKPANLLFILSDEHSRRVLGCYGHGMIRTPNLDRLAAAGVRFSDAYTNSPICVPARAASAGDKPWVLFVALVCPHFPLIARPEWYGLYPEDEIPVPALYEAAERQPDHPYIAAIRECQVYDKSFDEVKLRRAVAAYF